MAIVSLLGLGSGSPDYLPIQAKDRLANAHLLIVDSSVEPTRWQPHASAGARVVLVSSQQEEHSARDQMLAQAAAGHLVVRARAGDGFTCEQALRDARVLHDARVSFEFVPGVREQACEWASWLAARPLFGRRIVITRMREQATQTAGILRERGALPWIVPTIELQPPPDRQRLEQAVSNLASYRLVAFTSANGVDQFFAELERQGLDARSLGSLRVASIGSATATALRQRGIRADAIAKEFRGEDLAQTILQQLDGSPGPVLLPRALEAREVLPEVLAAQGVVVDVVPAYRTVAPEQALVHELATSLDQGLVDAIVLTSSSTARNLCQLLGPGYRQRLARTCLASIGPVTTQTAVELGLSVAVTARVYTIDGLIEALEQHFAPDQCAP